MSTLSETTLENVSSVVESLRAVRLPFRSISLLILTPAYKQKLAEHRLARERQSKLFDQRMEEQKKEQRHYV
jgi:hypothetical protein